MTRRVWWGIATGLGSLLLLVVAMLLIRSHLSVATDALLLVIPVVVGVSMGGFPAGAVSVVAGFLAYDFFFIPPYGTLTVGAAQNWIALFVYVIVLLIVARVVSFQQIARAQARDREDTIRRLFVVSQQMISAQPLDDVLTTVVTTVRDTFDTTWVMLLLPDGETLVPAATAGHVSEDDVRRAVSSEVPHSLALSRDATLSRVALTANGRPVGQLVVAGATLTASQRDVLGTFAHQAALAIERSQLTEKAQRSEVLEDADRWRNALMGAVSHDLRTPLASMKMAVSTLRHDLSQLSEHDRDDLLAMIEDQSDFLAQLVANLLDMARLEAGGLSLRREPHAVADIVASAVTSVAGVVKDHDVVVEVDEDLPLVDVDVVLITRVLVNLLSNAAAHGPLGSTIRVTAAVEDTVMRVSVCDQGLGVDPADRERIFKMLDRRAGSGRAGLGLAISTSFVSAHGATLIVDDAPGGGARFSFTLPLFADRSVDA